VTSLLSIVEQVVGVPSCYKTVEAFAGENGTKIIRIPVEGFCRVAAQHYTAFRQLTRVVALRMHRVTFVALYRFLGLGKELTPECSVACGESDNDTMENLTARATEETMAGKRRARGSKKAMVPRSFCALIHFHDTAISDAQACRALLQEATKYISAQLNAPPYVESQLEKGALERCAASHDL
jgi:hypothetical protein